MPDKTVLILVLKYLGTCYLIVAVPSPYPDATIAFVTVRERLTSVPGHDLRADAIDGMRRMCKQMCNMCKQNWAMWRGSNSNGHFKAEIPTSVLIELVPVGS